MASITINIDNVLKKVDTFFDKIKDKEYLLRPLAIETIANMKPRIHQDGKASDGNQIGEYSNSYMKVRTGDYGNSQKYSKGANKGKNKNAGIFTKKKVQLYGYNFGVFIDITKSNMARPNYGRSNDKKVVVSLTRQLENDYQVIATPEGYGIGFNNKLNFDKAKWVEERKKKIIFNTSEDEKKYIRERLEELVHEANS